MGCCLACGRNCPLLTRLGCFVFAGAMGIKRSREKEKAWSSGLSFSYSITSTISCCCCCGDDSRHASSYARGCGGGASRRSWPERGRALGTWPALKKLRIGRRACASATGSLGLGLGCLGRTQAMEVFVD